MAPTIAPGGGARFYGRLLKFDFRPTIGISAARVDKFDLDIRSFREPLQRVVKLVMIPSFQANFAAGGRPIPWASLAPDYAERTRGNMDAVDDHILVLTGRLQRTMGQLNIWDFSKTTATIKGLPTRVWYGAVHQAGAGVVPQRIFALFQQEDIPKAQKIFELWLMERWNKAWPAGT